jgi:catechol 2,3-dioxygenase-like lactoylglutathione lyase family enzyme
MLQMLRQLSKRLSTRRIWCIAAYEVDDAARIFQTRHAYSPMKLDHVTIVTPDCEPIRHFLVDIAGMRVGPRPPFGIGGYWLYLDGVPAVHLIENGSVLGSPPGGRASTRIDHLALRVQGAAEWRALLARLHEHAIPFSEADVPLAREQQVFVQLAPGVVVEFVTSPSSLSSLSN